MLVVSVVSKVSNWIYSISCWFIKIILAVMVLATAFQIISRVFFTALSWSEELTRYLLVWLTFIGAGCVLKTNGHISVTAFQDLLGPRMRKWSNLLVNLACLIFFGLATYYGSKYMSMQGGQLSAALRIPMKYIYLSIPIGFSIMIVYTLDNILQLVFAQEENKA